LCLSFLTKHNCFANKKCCQRGKHRSFPAAALAAEDEDQVLFLNGQALRPKASFLPDYPPILIASGLALWSGSPGGGFLHEQRAWVSGCWPGRLPLPLALA
jgi:hypothetical protein